MIKSACNTEQVAYMIFQHSMQGPDEELKSTGANAYDYLKGCQAIVHWKSSRNILMQ